MFMAEGSLTTTFPPGTDSKTKNQAAGANAGKKPLGKDAEEDEEEDYTSERKLPSFLQSILLQEPDSGAEERLPPILLGWWSLTHFFSEMDPISRTQFMEPLTAQMVDNALSHLFALLPDNSRGTDEVNRLFTEATNYQQVTSYPSLRDKIVCQLYYQSCAIVPKLVRQWHGSLKPEVARVVNQ